MNTKKLALTVTFLLLAWGLLRLFLISPEDTNVVIIGHRGLAHVAPENTIAGIKTALEKGINYIEVDVRRTNDGVLVLMHDKTVDRTTNGQGNVHQLDWDYLKTLDAGVVFQTKFENTQVPDLSSIFELMSQTNAFLLLEVKNPELYPNIEYQIVEKIQEYDLQDQTIIISFDQSWLEKVSVVDPSISLGVVDIGYGFRKYPDSIKIVDVNWIMAFLDPTLIYRAHRNGYKVFVWTVDNPYLIDLMAVLGVDGVTTNSYDGNKH